MKAAVVALLALLGLASASPVVLDDSSFNDAIASGETYFVKFYAPWCGHCKRLAPTWDALSTEVEAKGVAAKVAKVDCTVARDTCSAASIRGYPTLMLFKGGNKEGARYSGPREVPAFMDFLANNLGDAAPAESA